MKPLITPWIWPHRAYASRWACHDVRCLVASPDGRTLWVGREGSTLAFEVASGRVVATIPCGTACLTVTDDEVITYGDERAWWRRVAGAWTMVRAEPLTGGSALAAARDAAEAVSVGYQDGCHWNTRRLPVDVDRQRTSIALDPAGERCVLVGGGLGQARALYVVAREDGAARRSPLPLYSYRAPMVWVGEDIVIGQRAVTRCSPHSGEVRWTVEAQWPRAVAASRDGTCVAFVEDDHEDGTRVTLLRAEDGALVASWRARSGRLVWRGDGGERSFDAGADLTFRDEPWSLEVAPDGAWCAVGFRYGVVVLGARGEVLGLPNGGEGEPAAAAWLPDGRLALGYENTPAIRVLRHDARDADVTLEHDDGLPLALFPAPDGRRLAALTWRQPLTALHVFEVRGGASIARDSLPSTSQMSAAWDDEGVALWVHGRWQSGFALWRVDAASGATRRVWERASSPTARGVAMLWRAGGALFALQPDAALTLDPRDGSVLATTPWPAGAEGARGATPSRYPDARGRAVVDAVGGFDLGDGALLWRWPADTELHEELKTTGPSGRWFLTEVRAREEMRIRATRTGEVLGRYEAVYDGWYVLSADGRSLAVIAQGVVHTWRVDVDAIEAACDAADDQAHEG